MRGDLNGADLAGWKCLAPAAQSALTSQLARQAHEARSRLVGKALLEAVRTIQRSWANHLRRRRRERDFAELVTLDDLSLRDMGISRLDIRSAIRSRTDLRATRR